MDKSKKNTRSIGKTLNPWKGIPASERRDVRMMIAVAAVDGKKVSPRSAYDRICMWRHDDSVNKAAEEKKRSIDDARGCRDRAREALDPALVKLATVRDVLHSLGEGEDPAGLTPHDVARMCKDFFERVGWGDRAGAFRLGVDRAFPG